ncbi:hypothetical protein ACOMCU_26440 [Lysinibacillus sp. UGB7]|uniref:hypothetical protein n=1 Tax=Lysinibacillus sp. UGB7 TaxID=3411039 RepID=UPI003B7B7BAB
MTATKSNSSANNQANLPISTLTFHLNTSIYKMVNGALVKCMDEKVEIGDVYPLLAINDDIAELTEGRFVKGIAHQNPSIHYGVLEVIGETANACSRNGITLRKLQKGQKFKVKAIQCSSDKSVKRFSIGKHEYISSKEPIRFIAGYLLLKNSIPLVNEEKPLTLEAHKAYAFSEVYGSHVLLTDYEDTWVDVNGIEYTINHMTK